MPVAHWNPRYETGIQFIDDQHKQLLDLVNKLHDGFQSGMPKDEINALLDFMVVYIANHFTTEESFMQEHGYPDLKAHQAQHMTFMTKVKHLAERWKTSTPPTASEFARFIQDWLAHHVSEVDMGFTSWARRR